MLVSNPALTQEYQTKAQVVLQRIRRAIITGELAAGQKIPQDQIAAELGISRIPIREALQKLEEQGFITIIPHHGAVVTHTSSEEIKELYLVRLQLELLATRATAVRMTAAKVAVLQRILDAAEIALEAQDFERLSNLNQQFHQVAYEISGYPVLCKVIADVRLKCERYRLFHANLPERAAIALQEHKTMLQAWADQDPDAAELATCTNMANSARAVLAALEPGSEDDWSQAMITLQPRFANIA